MYLRTLGLNLNVSAVGLGCMGMTHAYGTAVSSSRFREIVSRAVDFGYTFFDTAEIYGVSNKPHLNEEELGRALRQYRDKVVIGTKFGITFDTAAPGINKPIVSDARESVIRTSVENSLKRLQTDHIDIYYQHRQDPKVPVEEVASVMADLIKEGKILHWGLSEVDGGTIRRAHSVCPVTAVQNRYSMMARHHECLFPVLEELNIGLVAFSPLANGVLSGCYDENSKFDPETDYRSVMPQFSKEAMERNRELFTFLKQLASDKKASMSQISLAWMLNKKKWIVPIPGTTDISRLEENAGASEIRFSEDEVHKLDHMLSSLKMSGVFGVQERSN